MLMNNCLETTRAKSEWQIWSHPSVDGTARSAIMIDAHLWRARMTWKMTPLAYTTGGMSISQPVYSTIHCKFHQLQKFSHFSEEILMLCNARHLWVLQWHTLTHNKKPANLKCFSLCFFAFLIDWENQENILCSYYLIIHSPSSESPTRTKPE